MRGFSTVDGFMDVKESVEEMIKYLANEPSIGLFFVQQHTQNAVPNLITLKDKVVEKSHEITLHTEDFEDSIDMVRSMKECGFTIADEMNRDIKKSLLIMSTSQPNKGLIHNPNSGFQIDRSRSWGPVSFSYSTGSTQPDGGGGSYLSTVLNSAKQRAAALRWPQLDVSQSRNPKGERYMSSPAPPESLVASSAVVSTLPDMEADKLLSLSPINDEQFDSTTTACGSLPTQDLSLTSENFDKFKSDQEAKLKEWLEETENCTGTCNEAS